jgi:polysaccharide export outer membrane protein
MLHSKLSFGGRLLLCAVACGAIVRGVDPVKTPKELLDFVRDARAMGLQDDQIRRGAVKAGWSETVVSQALSIQTGRPSTGGAARLTPADIPPDYRIGAGDVLQVVVWKEPDASVPAAMVRSDGRITLPLVKEIYVLGLTPAELERSLTEKLGKYVVGADVTVVPSQIVSNKIYLIGGVRREGPVVLSRSMTVLQAITEAGGVTDYAKTKRIYVLRNQDGKQVRLPFDYNAVIKGERIEQNITLMPDDTVVVPR